jgi:ATP-dependent DNA helicase MPH1
MSDDFDDDSFLIDDSFLREVDTITAKATSATAPSRPIAPVSGFATASSFHSVGSKPANKGWTGPQLPIHAGPSFRPVQINKFQQQRSFPLQQAGPSKRNISAPTLPFRPAAPPSSDDFDDFPLPLDFDAASKLPVKPPNPTILPSSRKTAFQRTSSGPTFQTHLNFRKDNQSTKGKRWDRTQFAETGRRIAPKGLDKGKGKGKGKAKMLDGEDEDEEDEEENFDEEAEDWSRIIPGPKPLVDPSELCVHAV